MQRRSIITVCLACLASIIGVLRWRTSPAATQSSSGMMDGGMMGDSMQDMMSSANMNGPMKTGMELFRRHKLIKRRTIVLADGVTDITSSDDPETTKLIQTHVIEMYQRLAANRPFPYPASQSVTEMFAQSADYKRQYKLLSDGIEVTETSTDPQMVSVIKAHAQELDRFAAEGMPAMMQGMMKNGMGM